MDSLITAAARALSAGDPLAALNRVALREDPPALALRGIAMAQLGELVRARALLRQAARAFGSVEPAARARCVVAEAEIALVSRDLGPSTQTLEAARVTLEQHGDQINAAHAAYLEARKLLLIGRLDEAERVLADLDAGALPPASRVGHQLVVAGVAMRRVRAEPAREALGAASRLAQALGIPSLTAEVDRTARALEAPAARLFSRGEDRLIGLEEVEALLASDTLVVDGRQNAVRTGGTTIQLARRPILFALVSTLARAWPQDVAREDLLAAVFRAREADESHRARLRVEIGRLRKALESIAALEATKGGYALCALGPRPVAVLAPPAHAEHGDLLALLADGEAWASSGLALALDVTPRTVLRALETLAAQGKVERFGRGRACRWIAASAPGFPTSLLLSAAAAQD